MVGKEQQLRAARVCCRRRVFLLCLLRVPALETNTDEASALCSIIVAMASGSCRDWS